MILVGHVTEQLRKVREKSVHCVVSSPPYYGLRDYGIPPVQWRDGMAVFGLEKNIGEYVGHTLEVFEAIGRVLRDDGVVWWNIGDTYAVSGRGGNPAESEFRKQATNAGSLTAGGWAAGYQAGDKCLIPHRVAIALQDAGWCVRQDVVWKKASPMPECLSGWRWVRCRVKIKGCSVPNCGGVRGTNMIRNGEEPNGWTAETHPATRTKAPYLDCSGCAKCAPAGGYVLRRGAWRCTTGHEYIFMVTKSNRYFCDGDAVAEPVADINRSGSGNKARKWGNNETDIRVNGTGDVERQSGIPLEPREIRNPRSVWTMSSEPCREAHFATFPGMLPFRCIKASTSDAGCCSACGACYAPVVESERIATRPGGNTKVPGRNSRFFQERDPQHDGEYKSDRYGIEVGNRDPERHIAVTKVTGHRPSCSCNAGEPIPCTVLDTFGGSGTTAVVAEHLKRSWILCEINPTYAAIAEQRIKKGWTPPKQKKPKRKKKPSMMQKDLFAGIGDPA